MRVSFIASTGRTATTYLAGALNRVPGVLACHEGYAGSDKEAEPVLPLINIENNSAYQKPEFAHQLVADKRNPQIFETIANDCKCHQFIDIAYYNSTIASALLAALPEAKLIGIIRDCESFVRSATTLSGEDLLPVGWPPADKALSPRERFISFGRMRPRKDSDESAQWKSWSAITKNIWLWRETNKLLLEAARKYPQRVLLLPFSLIKQEQGYGLFRPIAEFLNIDEEDFRESLLAARENERNRKPEGYQIGTRESWTEGERVFLESAQAYIDKEVKYVQQG